MRITKSTTVNELLQNCPHGTEAGRIAEFCITRPLSPGNGEKFLCDVIPRGFDVTADCLNYALACAERDGTVTAELYSEEEKAASPDKNDALMAYFKGSVDKPTVLIVPGGGYNMVSTIDDGIRIAKEVNMLGLSAAVLKYRIRQTNVFPKAMDDLAAAVGVIERNSSVGYILAGFSSGGHMSALWCSKEFGYEKYGLPRPSGVLLAYPLISISRKYIMKQYELGITRDLRGIPVFMNSLLGESCSFKEAEKLDADKLVSAECPPVFMAHGRMDTAVYCSNSELFAAALDSMGVRNEVVMFDHLGHAFSDGAGTEAEGWIKNGLEFLEVL